MKSRTISLFGLLAAGLMTGILSPAQAQCSGGYCQQVLNGTGDKKSIRAADRGAISKHRLDKDALLAYVITVGFQFGVVDLANGTFLPIGPNLPPDVGTGLVSAPEKSVERSGKPLLTLGFTGNLDAIDPLTGRASVVGPTGLHDCSTPDSPYDPTCANLIGRAGETVYVTDFANNLYSVNPATGAATPIGNTGMPALPYVPFSTNPDGSTNVYAETLFGFHGRLYATFAAAAVNFATGAETIQVPGALYELNRRTGEAIMIASTNSNLTSVVTHNDTVYAFDASTGQVVILDLADGETTPLVEVDPNAGVIAGATAAHQAPE